MKVLYKPEYRSTLDLDLAIWCHTLCYKDQYIKWGATFILGASILEKISTNILLYTVNLSLSYLTKNIKHRHEFQKTYDCFLKAKECWSECDKIFKVVFYPSNSYTRINLHTLSQHWWQSRPFYAIRAVHLMASQKKKNRQMWVAKMHSKPKREYAQLSALMAMFCKE